MQCKLLLIVSDKELRNLEHALHHQAIPQWNETGQLCIWVWCSNKERLLSMPNNEVVSWTDIPIGITVIITKAVPKVPISKIQSCGTPLLQVRSTKYFTQNNIPFGKLLDSLELSWRTHAENLFKSYDHRVTDFGVEEWLKQFEKIGFPQLGEMLLKVTKIMATDECVQRLSDSYNENNNNPPRWIAVLSRMGKSGAALSGGLRRKFNDIECQDISDCITRCNEEDTMQIIHVFEDGLWTGIELQKVIYSLAGKSIKPKVHPLTNPSTLNQHTIILHFAVVTDLGCYAAQSIFAQEKLQNWSIATDSAHQIRVLTTSADELFFSKQIGFAEIKNFVVDQRFIRPQIAIQMEKYTTPDAWHSLLAAYKQIGKQLWEYNNKDTSATLSAETQEHLAFGANGIGSAYIFRHSAPRAASPLLWASGPITWGQKQFFWKALFPEKGKQDHNAANNFNEDK